MSQDSGDIEAAENLTKAFNELSELILLLRRDQQANNSTNSQTMTIDAGGPAVWIAVWIASICCAVMLTLSMVSRSDQIDQKRRIDLANDKLSVVLQWAPELAKKVDQSVHEKERSK